MQILPDAALEMICWLKQHNLAVTGYDICGHFGAILTSQKHITLMSVISSCKVKLCISASTSLLQQY